MTNKPNSDTRKSAAALLLLLADWEELDYVRLTDKANAFVEAMTELAVKRVRADMREPSRVSAPPFNAPVTHYMTEDLLDACGQAPSNVDLLMVARWENVTCPACRKIAPTALTYDEASAGMGHDE